MSLSRSFAIFSLFAVLPLTASAQVIQPFTLLFPCNGGDGSDGAFDPATMTFDTGAKPVWNFTQFTLNQAVTVDGAAAQIIRSQGPIIINGTLDARGRSGQSGTVVLGGGGLSTGGAGGPGGFAGGQGGQAGILGLPGHGPGGGGGGGFAFGTPGGGGGGGAAAAGEPGGIVLGGLGLFPGGAGGAMVAHCRGGSGGGGGGYDNANGGGPFGRFGGGGGGGGGLLVLMSDTSIQISPFGRILVDGGRGGTSLSGGVGGGGAGGTVVLVAPSIQVLGQVSALGGAGGVNPAQPSARGGRGSDGAIKIFSTFFQVVPNPLPLSGPNFRPGYSQDPHRVYLPLDDAVAKIIVSGPLGDGYQAWFALQLGLPFFFGALENPFQLSLQDPLIQNPGLIAPFVQSAAGVISLAPNEILLDFRAIAPLFSETGGIDLSTQVVNTSGGLLGGLSTVTGISLR